MPLMIFISCLVTFLFIASIPCSRAAVIRTSTTQVFSPTLASPMLASATPSVSFKAMLKKTDYSVDGTTLPNVPFDIGNSYAGLMPISPDLSEKREFFFWFFPSTLEGGSDDLTVRSFVTLVADFQDMAQWWPRLQFTVWGGPRAWAILVSTGAYDGNTESSFLASCYKYALCRATDWCMPTATSEVDISNDFLGFLLQFTKMFPETQGMKLHFTGESYAGQYLPYIQHAVYTYIDKINSTSILNPKSLFVIDGLLENSAFFQTELTTWPFVQANQRYLGLNASTLAYLKRESANCGYDNYLAANLKWPAVHVADFGRDQCQLWPAAIKAAALINPCFDPYDVRIQCPTLVDIIDNEDPTILNYFSRRDVQDVIHAPHQPWKLCVDASDVFNPFDTSYGVDNGLLQSVIPRNERTIWTAANHDFIVMTQGTQLLLNSMSWGGAQGFNSKPSTPFVVAAGQRGVWHEERGLTYVEVWESGHQIPIYAPRSAYKILQYMLGQIASL